MRVIRIFFVFLFFMTFFCNKICIADEMHIESKKFLPELPFFDLDDNELYFDQIESEILIIFFWASWCDSCINELISLDLLQKDFRKLPLKVVAISQDYKNKSAISNYYEANNIRYLDIFYDYKNSLFNTININTIPVVVIAKNDNTILDVIYGSVKWHDDDVRSKIISFMSAEYDVPRNSYIKNNIDKSVINIPIKKSN